MRLVIPALLILLLMSCPAETIGQTRGKTTVSGKSSQKGKPGKAAKTTATKAKPKTKKQLQQEQAEAQRRRRAEQQRAQQLQQNIRTNLDSILILNRQIARHTRTLDSLQAQRRLIQARLDSLQAQHTRLQAQLQQRKDRYAHALLAYRHTQTIQQRLTFIFSADHLPQLLRRHRYIREYTAYQRAQGQLIKEKQAEVTAAYNQLLDARYRLQANLQQQQQTQRTLQAQHSTLQSKATLLGRNLAATQKQVAQYQQREAALAAEIDRLVQAEIEAERRRQAQAEARRRAAEEAKRKANAKTPGKPGKSETAGTAVPARPVRTAKSPSQPTKNASPLSATFAANKGRLPMPASGSPAIVRRYGNYTVAGLRGVTLQNHGIDIRTQPGASALAIFQGQVSGIYQYGGTYIVMLRHGSYISVYSGLRSVSVSKGQSVSTQQPLGAIATDGDGHTTLHLQLRHETQLLNPEQWIR